MEELGLSHILNAEGEKLQYILGTLPGLEEAADFDEVMKVNRSVQDTLSDVMEQRALLTAKLSAAMKALVLPGPAGPTGATSPGLTSAFAANTQVLPAGVTTNSGNTVFTVAEAGTYQISYHVNTSLSLLMGTRLVINGTNNTASTIAPGIAASRFENQITVNLPANSTISLQMYPFTLAGAAVLVGGGAGAYLTIIRLSSGGTHKPPDGKINVNTFLNAVQRYPNTRSAPPPYGGGADQSLTCSAKKSKAASPSFTTASIPFPFPVAGSLQGQIIISNGERSDRR